MRTTPFWTPENPSDEALHDGVCIPVWRRGSDGEEITEGKIKMGEPVIDENYGMLGYVSDMNGNDWNGDIVVRFKGDYSTWEQYEDDSILRCSLD